MGVGGKAGGGYKVGVNQGLREGWASCPKLELDNSEVTQKGTGSSG